MEEDIDYLKRHIKVIGKTRSTEAIENLVNKYKEQEKQIAFITEQNERLGKSIEEFVDREKKLFNSHIEKQEKNKEQEKMIELMARFIKINTSDDGLSIRPATIEEKIEFFRKKAKGE